MRRVKFKVVYVSNDDKRYSAFAKGKYNLYYPKGAIVRAREGTLGVAVFETRYQAESFQRRRPYEIIRVRPIGRGKIVDFIYRNQSETGLDKFYNKNLAPSMVSPCGTVFYPAVEVLE